MDMKAMSRSLIAGLLMVTGPWAERGLAAEDEYYAGKTVFVYVGRPPGSGADLAVRSFVRFWPQHIPGHPTMVVKNVPGGGGSRVWNLAWGKQQSKALEIYFSPVSGAAEIVREKGLRADQSKMPLVGSLMSPNLTFARTDRLQRAQDLLDVKGLRFGGQAPAHRFSILGRMALDILGVEYRNVTGFRGSSDIFNAVRRGEVDIQTAPLNFYRFTVEPNMVDNGQVIPLWYNPVVDENGEVIALPEAGDIPSFIEYYQSLKGRPPEGELFETYKWMLANLNGITYAAFLPPGAPPDPFAILRTSFAAVAADESYRDEEKKMFGFNLPLVSPQRGTEIIRDMTHAPEHIRTFLARYIREGR